MRNPVYAAPLTAVGLISAAALAYEILLTRIFAIVHWHHLVATAISLALLGYGASGTFLAVMGKRLQPYFAPAFIANALVFSLSSLACVTLAQRLPFDPQALTGDWSQLLYLAGTFLILAVPFFAAANCVGLSLWHFQTQIPRVYGFDLIGAGLGALALLGGLAVLTPAGNLFGVFLAGMLVAGSAAATLRWHSRRVAVACLLITSLAWAWGRPVIQPAAYKDLTRSLAIVGATIDHQASGISGTLSVVRNDQVPTRVAPGLSLNATALPPRQLAVFVDGDAAGTLPASAADDESSAYLHDLSSALPYALLDAPRVAVLNAGVGLGITQAIRLGASSVTGVEPNPQLQALACERYPHANARTCGPGVELHTQAARPFVAGNADAFDLIILHTEADNSGLDALSSDYDLTREAFVSYLDHLSPGGLLAIDGPTRVPPRLSLRMLNTARAALLQLGVENPGRHIAAIRGWQRFALLVSNEPLDAAREAAIRSFADARGFDLVWLPNIRPADANRYQQLSEAHYYLGAAAILDGTREASGLNARFRILAASDDIPFPNRFTRWTEWWSALYRGGRAELTQLDTGFLVATVTLALVTVIGILLIILPLFWPGRESGPRTAKSLRVRTLLYFGLVGIAFLFIEMAWIQRLQLFLGHPVYATTSVLVAFLVFAGLGSLWSQRHSGARANRLLIPAVVTISFASLLYIFYLPAWLLSVSGLPLAGRIGIVLVLLAPLAFAMGIPFPTGLKGLGRSATPLIPWAWGINGCTSVISAAGAPLLAMEIGFNGLIAVAVVAYLLLPAIRMDSDAES